MPPNRNKERKNRPVVNNKLKPNASKYFAFLSEWKEDLETKLKKSLPRLDAACQEAFVSSCHSVLSANQSIEDAKAVLEQLQKQTPKDPVAIQQATQAVQDAKAAFDDALDTCQKVAVDTLLDKDPLATLFTDDFDDADLVTYTVLCHGSCKGMAKWCDEHEEDAESLLAALKDPELLRLFLESGGARSGAYGSAVQLYHQLSPPSKKDIVLQRLALAVALELADPYPLFNKSGETDALQRYVHYEQAYLLGELDPSFASFNVWELRQVVNSDATDEELSWGRQSLQNYRPDIALQANNPQWQYCMIVRTDVSYTDPDWYKGTRSYDQILSGGGKCGPRAWYGRFICKAFGIPTWGVRQPGHAAMTRWTPNQGWCVCLGGGMWKSWWEDQGGPDFVLETKARSACESERQFMQKVLRLQWISQFWNEEKNVVRMKGLPDPKSPWCSLGMMQRRRLGGADTRHQDDKPQMLERISSNNNNKIAQMLSLKKANAIIGDPVSRDVKTGAIVIPATSCSSPSKKSKKVSFLPSFLGGQQLFVQEDAEIEFTLSSVDFDTARTYKLTCLVCTVHRSEEPILLTVMSGEGNDPDAVHVVNMPYTVGMWEETEPVIVEVGGAYNKLRLSRPKQPKGFSFKEIRLVPV